MTHAGHRSYKKVDQKNRPCDLNPSTVSKWCTNSSQPDVASLLKIADLLEVDIKELLVREYEQFLLSKIKD